MTHSASKLLAAIVNPALPQAYGNVSSPAAAGGALAKILATLWQTIVTVGGIALLIYLIMAGFNWVMAGGDKAKIEAAKSQITQGIIGMIILTSIAALTAIVSEATGIDLLKPQFTNLVGP